MERSEKLSPEPNQISCLSIFEWYLFIVFDLILQDDSIGPVGFQPSQGNAVPRYLFSLDQSDWGRSCQKKKNQKNQEFSCNEKHVFLITAFTTWALPEMEIFLLQRLESLSIFPGFANKIVFNPL